MGVLTWPGDQFELCVDGFLVRLARAVENEQRVNIDEEMLDAALDNMIDCGELASPQMVEMEAEAEADDGDYFEDDGW